jgi:hypothetical protein
MSKSVSLKKVEITNYKGIEKLSEEMNGNHFIFFGHNGAGKTSLLEVINRSALRIKPEDMATMPIKVGAKNAQTGVVYIVEENGEKTEILVDTVYRPSGSVMKIVDLKNNGELKPTMERLSQLIGQSHDVSPLMDMDGKEQFKYLLKILGGNVSADNYERDYKDKYTERRLLNKNIVTLQNELDKVKPDLTVITDFRTKGLYIDKKELPNSPDKSDLITKLSEAEKVNLQFANYESVVVQIEKEIEALQKRLEAGKKWLKDNPKVDVEPIKAEIAQFDTTTLLAYENEKAEIESYNANVDNIILWQKKQKELFEKEGEKDKLQKSMDALKESMQKAISSLKVEDFAPELKLFNEIDEEGNISKQGLYYNIGGKNYLPFNRCQISYGKCIVALAKISSFINYGKLNMIHIPAWESLDDISRKEILQFAENNADLNIQFAIEEVQSKPIGIKVIDTSDAKMPKLKSNEEE